MKSLVKIFDKNKCDKGSARHRYDRVYEPALRSLRDKEFRMLEIGIFQGRSLQSWVDYFPNATIAGIDIFTRVPPERVPTLNHPRVKWCRCDSLKGPNDNFDILLAKGRFDVIIDDGLHTHDAQRMTFENFFPYLNQGGVYFIEDVWAFDHLNQQEKNHTWIKSHPNDFSDRQYDQLMAALKPYETKFHDLRKGFHTDTFIIEVRK